VRDFLQRETNRAVQAHFAHFAAFATGNDFPSFSAHFENRGVYTEKELSAHAGTAAEGPLRR